MRPLPLIAAAFALAACGGQASTAAPAQAGQPLETRAANAPDQTPAFPGQTRAPLAASNVAFDVVTVAEGLEKPWGLAFLPSGEMLVTEKAGRLRIVGKGGGLSAPVTVAGETLYPAAHLCGALPARLLRQSAGLVREQSRVLVDALDAVVSGI